MTPRHARKPLLAALTALTLFIAPSHAQVSMAVQVGASTNYLGPLLDVPAFHLSCHTPIHLCFDGAIGISWGNGGVYDAADGDLSYDAIRVHENTTLAPRLGFSTVIFNDKATQNGVNVGIALRSPALPWHHNRTPSEILRLDAVYRRLGGHTWGTLAAGVEWRL